MRCSPPGSSGSGGGGSSIPRLVLEQRPASIRERRSRSSTTSSHDDHRHDEPVADEHVQCEGARIPQRLGRPQGDAEQRADRDQRGPRRLGQAPTRAAAPTRRTRATAPARAASAARAPIPTSPPVRAGSSPARPRRPCRSSSPHRTRQPPDREPRIAAATMRTTQPSVWNVSRSTSRSPTAAGASQPSWPASSSMPSVGSCSWKYGSENAAVIATARPTCVMRRPPAVLGLDAARCTTRASSNRGSTAVALTSAPSVSTAIAGSLLVRDHERERARRSSAPRAGRCGRSRPSGRSRRGSRRRPRARTPCARATDRRTVHTIDCAGGEAREHRDHPVRLDVRLGARAQPGREPARERRSTPARRRPACSPRSGRRSSTAGRSDDPAASARRGCRRRSRRSGRRTRRSRRRSRTAAGRPATAPWAAITSAATGPTPTRPRNAARSNRRNPPTARIEASTPTARTGLPGMRSSPSRTASAVRRAVRLPCRREQRLVGRAGGGSDNGHGEQPDGGQRKGADAAGGRRSGPHDPHHG